MSDLNKRFLPIIQEAHRRTIEEENGHRGHNRQKVLHGWIREEIQDILGNEYELFSLSDYDDSKEIVIDGRYYKKKVDVSVYHDRTLVGIVSCKFVNTSYINNSNNYFESLIGEVVNLNPNNIVFGNFFCLKVPRPQLNKNGSISKADQIRDNDIKKYSKLIKNHRRKHAPDCQAVVVVKLNEDETQIEKICDANDFIGLLEPKQTKKLLEMDLEQFFDDFTEQVKKKLNL